MHFVARLTGLLSAVAIVGLACVDTIEPAAADIVASGTTFTPNTLTLSATDTLVEWGFVDGPHTVTFEDMTPGSGQRSNGTFARNFGQAAPGTYRFRCDNHSVDYTTGMVGSIIVP